MAMYHSLRDGEPSARTTVEYRLLLEDLIDEGEPTAPRGLLTRELLGYQTVIPMSRPVITDANRAVAYRFMAAEAAWILSGSNRVADIKPYGPHMARFSDDKLFMSGAYGPRVLEQLPYVAAALCRDSATRQAVMTLWRSRPGDTKDMPCTVSIQFMIRKGRFDAFVNMRSSDAWLGVPYDWFSFSMVAAYVFAIISSTQAGDGVRFGNLYFTAASEHLYAEHFDKAALVVGNKQDYTFHDYSPLDPAEFSDDPDRLVRHLWAVANKDKGKLESDFLAEVFDFWATPKEARVLHAS